MRNRIIFIANFVVFFLHIGCNSTLDDAQNSQHQESKEQKGTNQGQNSHLDAQGLPEYASVLSSGLSMMNNLAIPIGQVEILSNISENVQKVDPEKKIYDKNSMKCYEAASKIGLVTISEIAQNGTDQAGRGWNRLYTFTVTQKAKDLAVPEKSDADFISIALGTCTVLRIIKDEPYKRPNLPSSDDYRLCVGVHKFEPTKCGTEYFEALDDPVGKAGEYKFRAVIKFNPFMNSYSFLISDWGYVDKDSWETQNIK